MLLPFPMSTEELVKLPPATGELARAWKAFTESDDLFGLDVESTAIEDLGTHDRSIKMRTIQFGTKTEGWVLLPNSRWRSRIVRFLADPSKRFVSHNSVFDARRVLNEFGVDLSDRSVDTLPMAALLWPGFTAKKDLKSLCTRVLGDDRLHLADVRLHARFIDLYMAQKPRKTPLLPRHFEPGVSPCRRPKRKGEERCQNVSWTGSLVGYCESCWLKRGEKVNREVERWGWNNIPIDDPVFLEYAGLDAVNVRRLVDKLDLMLRERKMAALSRTEQKVKRYTVKTAQRGLRIDPDWTREVFDETRVTFEAAREAVEEVTHLPSGSPKMRDWFDDRGFRGITSLDREHLTVLATRVSNDPVATVVVENLQEISRLSNLLSNLRSILSSAEVDGLVHPSFNTQQAHTGRMSVTGPALQTLAKKGEKGRRLRGCFIARDGYVLVGADYDSQEIRLGAALSRDPAMMRIVREGLNQHVLTASSIFPDWVDKATNPDLYAKAKTLDFAQQYGAMPKRIALSMKISYDEAFEMWSNWRATYAGLVEWSERVAKRKWVRNPFSRLIPADERRPYANANYLIQSTGRDVLGAAMVRLADAGWADSFWMMLHDELVLEVPEDRAQEAADALTRHMTTEVLGVPIPAEGEIIGTRWRGLE